MQQRNHFSSPRVVLGGQRVQDEVAVLVHAHQVARLQRLWRQADGRSGRVVSGTPPAAFTQLPHHWSAAKPSARSPCSCTSSPLQATHPCTHLRIHQASHRQEDGLACGRLQHHALARLARRLLVRTRACRRRESSAAVSSSWVAEAATVQESHCFVPMLQQQQQQQQQQQPLHVTACTAGCTHRPPPRPPRRPPPAPPQC